MQWLDDPDQSYLDDLNNARLKLAEISGTKRGIV
jgi:hypothetical protein